MALLKKWRHSPLRPLLTPQARSWDEGVRFYDLTGSFLSSVELAGKNVKVLIVLEREDEI